MTGIDPRGPRFGAGITAAILLLVIGLELATQNAATSAAQPFGDPAFLLFAVLTGLWAWGATAGIQKHPFGWIFRTVVRPHLNAPLELEDPAPPTFAQGVGCAIGILGLGLDLIGVPYGLVLAASAAFVAAFLNSVFGFCLGCQLYLFILRLRLLSR